MDISTIINNDTPAKWYPIEDTNVEIQVKKIKPKDTKRLRKIATKKRMVRGRVDERLNAELYAELLLKEMVVGWKNIQTNNQDLPCTPENIILLNDNWNEFSELLTNILIDDADLEETYDDEIEKNSDPGPSST